MEASKLYFIWLIPLIGAAINLLVVPVLRIRSKFFIHTVAIASVAVSFIVAAGILFGLPGFVDDGSKSLIQAYHDWKSAGGGDPGPVVHQKLYEWIHVGTLQLDLSFRMDTLSAVMTMVVTFVGTLIHIFSTGYMEHEERYATYFGYLNLFTGAMLILVLGDSLPVMFIGWEGVGLCSYLLIGFWFEKTENANAGRKAFVVNRIGDFAFICGMLLLFFALTQGGEPSGLTWGELTDPALAADGGMYTQSLNSYLDLDWWFTSERLATYAGILLFIGACGKSAQIPLYVWLPDAMAGPTPVSALIHAATMVTAGVYMVARLSVLYMSSTTAMAVVATTGALTALIAAYYAFAQTDFKKVLAYSTVSQLGFMFVAVGVGAYTAGIFHLVTHAFFKAGLFLAAGSVMHAMSGSGDITKMGALRKKLPITHICFLVYCLAIAGFPLLSGFFSKDEILLGAAASKQHGWLVIYGWILWGILTLAALGTAFYMFRLYFLVFSGNETRCDEETKHHIHESPASMTGPLVVLAIGAAFLGLLGLPHLSAFHGLAEALPWAQLHDWLGGSVQVDVWTREIGGHASTQLTWGLMGVATVVGLIGIGLAYSLYKDGPSQVAADFAETEAGGKLYRGSLHKLWVDEIYESAIIKPFRWMCRALWEFADKFVIDLIFVNGSAFVVDVFGRVTRWFQNGMIQRYLAGLLVGGALIFYFASRPSAEMDVVVHNQGVDSIRDEILTVAERYPDDPGQRATEIRRILAANDIRPYMVTLRGNAGEGPGSVGSELTWYRDGKALEVQQSEVTIDLGSPGEYEFTLKATDGVFDRTKKVTRKLVIPDVVDLAYELERREIAEEMSK